MPTQDYKTIEAPSGSGELRKAGAHLANVFYYLEVRQGLPPDAAAAGPAEAPGRLDISGEVSISQDEPNQPQILKSLLSGEVLTLHLADGRRVEVQASAGDAFSGGYKVVATGHTGFLSG